MKPETRMHCVSKLCGPRLVSMSQLYEFTAVISVGMPRNVHKSESDKRGCRKQGPLKKP